MRKDALKLPGKKIRMGDNTQTNKKKRMGGPKRLKAGLPQVMVKKTKHKSLGGSPEINENKIRTQLYNTTRMSKPRTTMILFKQEHKVHQEAVSQVALPKKILFFFFCNQKFILQMHYN